MLSDEQRRRPRGGRGGRRSDLAERDPRLERRYRQHHPATHHRLPGRRLRQWLELPVRGTASA